ncbi:MAG TPA: DUF4286 family protein [Chitinophagaceae bacterium]
MFIYNLTIKVNNAILDEWMKWQTEEHIPEIMSTQLFAEHKFFRLLEQDDSEGPTFVIQYLTPVKENYDKYINEHAPKLREKAFKKWGDEFIAFRSLLQAVQ